MEENLKVETDRYILMWGDAIQKIKHIPDESIHFSIWSPPFPKIYTYSNDPRDLGNNTTYEGFFKHFGFLTPNVYRVMMPGRLVAIHCMNLPIMKGKEGFIGQKNFPGMIVDHMIEKGFIFHDEIVIWKDPVVEVQRTKAIGLLNKQKDKDASLSRTGIPDKLLIFRKPGDNPVPIVHSSTDPTHPNYLPVDLWQKYASPVWYDINYSDTLNKEGKEDEDEQHIAPLQKQTIRRAVHLWTNPDEWVLTCFLGIGSEVYEALKMGRRGIGIELKRSYFDVAVKNCKNAATPNHQLSLI
jgi:DNA modification methylase